MDFQFNATADGRRLKFLYVIEEHSRLCLAIRVGRRWKANDVVAVLEELPSLYPASAFIRSNNGPEFIAQELRDWCEARTTTRTAYIEPGSPWENGLSSLAMAGSGMSSSKTRCSPRIPRPNCWLSDGASSPPHSGAIGPPGANAPGGSSTVSCSMTTPTHSLKT
jgi:hypothetical protein